MEDIHSETFVKELFDEMAGTYGVVNLFSSLGFTWLWRKQAAQGIPPTGRRVCDLMTGGAECLPHLMQRCGAKVQVDLVDWCDKMCERAEATVKRHRHGSSRVIHASALDLPVENASYDALLSTFGLKTLAAEEIDLLAKEVRRVLKPGGAISLLEFSMPPNRCIRFFFRIYVKHYVPFLGSLFLGNPDNYRMLWRYTAAFGDCGRVIDAFRKAGFEVTLRSRFFGSATQIVGRAG